MVIFISQPMRDLSDEKIMSVREGIKKRFTNQHQDVPTVFISSFLADDENPKAPVDSNPRIWCLGRSISMLSFCDAIIFADGWRKAKGCRIEWEVAKEYGLKVYLEKENGKIVEY